MGGNGSVYMQIKAAICEKWQPYSSLRSPPLFYAYGHDAGQDERSQLFHLFFLRFFIDSFSGKDRCFEQKHFS